VPAGVLGPERELDGAATKRPLDWRGELDARGRRAVQAKAPSSKLSSVSCRGSGAGAGRDETKAAASSRASVAKPTWATARSGQRRPGASAAPRKNTRRLPKEPPRCCPGEGVHPGADASATRQEHLSRRLYRLPWPYLPMALTLGQLGW